MCVSCVQNNLGRLELIVGCMFAGKTEEFLRRIRRIKYAKIDFIIFKPQIDNRYFKDSIVSHNFNSMKCEIVKDSQEINKYLKNNPKIKVIGIDEIQFFDNKIVKLVEDIVNNGKIVIASGLDLDYKNEPFQNIKDLLPLAEFVDKLHAICIKCGNLASRTKKIAKNVSQNTKRILIGSNNFYEARCRNCYNNKN